MITQLDQLLTHLGTGRWSILHFVVLCYSSILVVPHIYAGVFLAPKIDYCCRPPEHLVNGSAPNTVDNTTIKSTSSCSNDTLVSQDQCRYAVSTTSGQDWVECTNWDFDDSTFASTVTSEFQLVCGREYLRTSYQSTYMFGIFIGAPLSAILADKYGRKMMFAVGVCLFTVLAMGSCWLPGLTELLASRLILGMWHSILLNSAYILAVEVAKPRYRTVLGFGIYLSWALCTMAWGGIAYLIREWRLLHLVVSLPGLILLPAVWFIDESPRWLMVQGRHDQALQVLRRASRLNQVPLPPEDELLHLMAAEVPPQKKTAPGTSRFRSVVQQSLKEVSILFLTPRLRFITIMMYIGYIVGALVYYGLSLSGGSLSDDPFVYMALTGLMEVPAYTLTIPIVMRFGRRAPAVVGFILSGAALVTLAIVPTGYTKLVIALAMVGKVTITTAYQAVIFFSSELFPTEVRSRGMGTCTMMSRVGSICSSYIVDFVGASIPWAPSVMFGIASFLVGMATMTLPETLGTTLPETVAHLEGQPNKTSSTSIVQFESEATVI